MIVSAPAATASEGTYLENILDGLKFLPVDLQRNMQLLYQLDAHAEQLREEIKQQQNLVLKSDSDSKKGAKPFDVNALRKLRRLERKCIKLLDEKLIIAKESHKIARSHLTRIDVDMQRFEREIGPYTRDDDFEDYMAQNIGIPTRSHRLSIDRSSPMVQSPLPLVSVPPSPRHQISDEPKSRASGPALSEQTYCYCKQASYGQMVACDDELCPIQWWHFKCAGISETPNGVWYCRICTERRRNEKQL